MASEESKEKTPSTKAVLEDLLAKDDITITFLNKRLHEYLLQTGEMLDRMDGADAKSKARFATRLFSAIGYLLDDSRDERSQEHALEHLRDAFMM